MKRQTVLPRPFVRPFVRATRLLGIVLLSLLVAACSDLPDQEATGDPPTVAVAEATATTEPSPTATLAPEPTAEPTETPEPTRITARVEIADQTITEEGVLQIDRVSLPENGWLALYDASSIGDEGFITAIPVEAGVEEDVTMTVDPRTVPETVAAMLYIGRERDADFAPPQGEAGLAAATATFDLTVDLPQPELVVQNQEIGENGELLIDEMLILEPTWVLVHAGDDGPNGAVLGRLLLEPGFYESVVIPIRWREGTPELHVVFHEDSGETGVLDYPSADLPLVTNGEPVTAAVAVTYPPDVVIYDQPVVNGEIVVERVISNGPGWVAIHYDDNGQPGLIIGSAALEDGLNERLAVDLIEEAITPIMYARLHTDSEPGGEFDFPRSDPPVRYENRLPEANEFRVDVGSYLLIADQPLGEDATVTASLVASVTGGWLAIYADEEGERGELLGATWVAEGLNREVVVALDSEPEPGPLHAVLHQDQGEAETFEFPGGPDTPVRVLGADVDVPFFLLEADTG